MSELGPHYTIVGTHYLFSETTRGSQHAGARRARQAAASASTFRLARARAALLVAGVFAGCALLGSPAEAHRPLLARSPPMGWNGYYQFGCHITEAAVRREADALVTWGMAARGYRYVELDDCWQDSVRSADGSLRSDPIRFPHGIAALVSYVHRRGLLFGIYLDAGTKTCTGLAPGSEGHFEQDARTVADWEVDLVKLDWCNTGNPPPRAVYAQFDALLRHTGRRIALSICDWGWGTPWLWAARIGAQTWRTAGDFTWYGAPQDWWAAVQQIAAMTVPHARYAHPGAWNEADTLLAGMAPTAGSPALAGYRVLTDSESRAQFSIWSMLALPLFASNDLTAMSKATRDTLLNRDVIAIDQDALAAPTRVRRRYRSGAQIWTRQLQGGDHVLLVFNPGVARFTARLALRTVGLGARRYIARDSWTGRTRVVTSILRINVAPRSALLLRLTPAK